MLLKRRFIKEIIRILIIAAVVVPVLGVRSASADTSWTQTSQADFQSGVLNQVDVTTSPGDVMLAKTSTANYIYAFYGASSAFARYDISLNSWTYKASAPASLGAGASLAYDGGNYIYALRGGNTSAFWRYSISSDNWTVLANACAYVNSGGSLVYDGGNYLYALAGGSTTFMRYTISSNSWTTLHVTPASIGNGGSLVYVNSSYLYALRGNSTSFYRYSISGDSWSSMTAVPGSVGSGAALTYDVGSYIYALRGGGRTNFYRYSISGNSWSSMASTPSTVSSGGALAYNNNYIYAFKGGTGSNIYWRYSISGNSWSSLANTLANATTGAALTTGNCAYYTSGDLTSSAWDTGISANFTTISWSASTPAGTTVKFQIATNNDNATWNFKGPDGTAGTYYTTSGVPIWSGADANRYVKYKAFLTTTDSSVTPVLNSVTISYTSSVVTPSATTNSATLVEETTTTLNGSVANDGGETCQYQFIYGTTAGGPYPYSTGWTGNLTTGQTFNANLTGLAQGTTYYYKAQVKNSSGTGTGAEQNYLTKPEAPTSFTAVSANSTQANLDWAKGIGAVRTKILRKTTGYPANFNDGTVVYFSTGNSTVDTGLSANTTYYYRAWSEVTAGVNQQWSDGYASASTATATTPVATTNSATLVEETTTTLNGSVANDGGEACQYQFVYGTTAGGPYPYSTGWTGSLITGQSFNVGVTGLSEGTRYYFVAQVKNSAGTASGAEFSFLTKPEAPTAFTAVSVNSTQNDLSWTKGAGAVRTKILRKTTGYPTNYNDGTVVYFGTGTGVSDTGLTSGTTYYYRAWSEVTNGADQQWSDLYASCSTSTATTPTAATSSSSLVEETTATLTGAVVNDGGEACQYQFIYGTTSGGPYPYNTGWTGTVTTGQTFNVNVTGLSQGTKYYFVAQVKNSAGAGSGAELNFLTKPEAPTAFTASVANAYQLNLAWTKGIGAQKTMVRRSTAGYPTSRTDGDEVYYDTGTSFSDTGLSPSTQYYYSAWSEVSGSEQWSDAYATTTATTSMAPPTTTPPATTPAVVGGTVFPVDKMQILAPYIGIFIAFLMLVGGVTATLVALKKKARR